MAKHSFSGLFQHFRRLEGDIQEPKHASRAVRRHPEEENKQPVYRTIVTRFESDKVFGFATIVDGDRKGEVVFLHADRMRPDHIKMAARGIRASMHIADGRRGLVCANIVSMANDATRKELDELGLRPPRPATQIAPPILPSEGAVGTLKFFNTEKGYGFVRLESGEEAYIPGRMFEALGLKSWRATGAKLSVEIVRKTKGLEVIAAKIHPDMPEAKRPADEEGWMPASPRPRMAFA